MSILLLKQIISLFLIMMLGFAIVKKGLLQSKDSKVLTVLSVYIILPCVIIKSFQIDLTPEIRNGILLAFTAAILIMFLFLGLTEIAGKLLHLNEVEKGSLIYSNCANLIIPLVTSVLGDEWVLYTSGFICVQMVFTWTHGKALIGGDTGFDWKKILLNINMIAILIGILLMVTGIRLPDTVLNAMDSVSATLGPLSMMLIGMLLADIDLKQLFRNRRIYLISFLRLFVFPLIVLVIIKILPLASLVQYGRTILFISYLAAMTPSAAMIIQLAQLYDKDAEYASAINVVTTLLCILSMPLMTELYMRF